MRFVIPVIFISSFFIATLVQVALTGWSDTEAVIVIDDMYAFMICLLLVAYLLFTGTFEVIFHANPQNFILAFEFLFYAIIIFARGNVILLVSIALSPVRILVLLINNTTLTDGFNTFSDLLIEVVSSVMSVNLTNEQILLKAQQVVPIQFTLGIEFTAFIGLFKIARRNKN